MVTKSFKNFLATILTANEGGIGAVPVTDVYGVRRYATNYLYSQSGFPYSCRHTYTLDKYASGVCFGTGGDAVNEEDYNLQNQITSGLSVLLVSRNSGIEDGCPTLTFTFSIVNTSLETIVIREVGYKCKIVCADTPGRNQNDVRVVMLDRTLLETPLVILPSDSATLIYTIKTLPFKPKTVNGVKIVPFEYGTDEEIGAIIDAAQAGTIDLQVDAGWRVGDMRKISIGAFMAGGDVTEPNQDIDIVISSFEEYNGCGNVMQFDFYESLSANVRMHSGSMTANKYGDSEMCTVTLPALVEELPDWLKDRLITFDVETVEGTVEGNKLALRSGYEVYGDYVYNGAAISNEKKNEGEAHIDWYRVWLLQNGTNKRNGYNGSNNSGWWFRSTAGATNNFQTAYIVGNPPYFNSYYNTELRPVAPFGCL